MASLRYAILAVLVLVFASAAFAGAFPATDVQDDPVRVRFRMMDGMKVEGTLTEWDATGIDGTFGPRLWTELDARDVWSLYRNLMDLDAASNWLDLGRILLLCSLDQPGAEKNAERSFARALRLDPKTEESIAEAREEVAMVEAAREAAREAEEAEKLETVTPEARDWRAERWPEMTQAEQNAAILTMRADAAALLQTIDFELTPVETEYFLFYSDLPRAESAKWARELDRMYAKVADIFSLDDGRNLFWGKGVIFVFKDQATFRHFQAEAFGYLAPEGVAGVHQPKGPKVFVSFYRQTNDLDFAGVLVHETVHGVLHRYRTPLRLPTWANEGFADYVSAVSFRQSPVDFGRRGNALEFIRNGGDVNQIINMTYTNGRWPGPNAIGYPVSYLLVRLMIQDRPRQFGDWVNAIKDGKEWELALIEEFGVDRYELADRFTRFHMVND